MSFNKSHHFIPLPPTQEATDVPILVSAVLLITSVLPMVPVSVKSHLADILDGFSRLANFNTVKPGKW